MGFGVEVTYASHTRVVSNQFGPTSRSGGDTSEHHNIRWSYLLAEPLTGWHSPESQVTGDLEAQPISEVSPKIVREPSRQRCRGYPCKPTSPPGHDAPTPDSS